ncbi:MAG: hypothetical protein FWF82_04930, partial [Oscillospiraceae bacterium]|nr:hypothetical protein [Oscillospiraceae bacterium]
VAKIKTEVAEIKEKQETMSIRVNEIHENVAKLEIVHGGKIGALYDSLVGLKESTQDVVELRETVNSLKFGNEVIELVRIVKGEKST